MALRDTLCAPELRPTLVDACVRLVDEEVARKSGFSALAIKGAFSVVKAIKPGFIREIVDGLFDEFVAALEGHHGRWLASGGGQRFGDFLQADGRGVADALLGVTDARARRTSMAQVRKLYEKLRPSAQDHVQAAVPGMARILDPHVRAG
jgi:hypothetical protein